MKFKTILFLFLTFIFSCKSRMADTSERSSKPYDSVIIDTLFKDRISIRAIQIDKNKIWYAADKNRFGVYDLISKTKSERSIIKDTLKLEFRSIAQTTDAVFVLSISNPGLLYKINKIDLKSKLVYQENNEKVFYDSLQFWNDQEGIAIGDPTEDCFSLIITRDGGNSWNKILCDSLPKLADAEAFFAASNSNIVIKGTKTFIVSGGKKARVFVSDDKGISWNTYNTPIVQGEAMTGIFSADFYNETLGFVVGGDYEKQEDNIANKAITIDGGKIWKLTGVNQAFGYASCVQFIPHKKGKQLVSVGVSGVFYSHDQGETWRKIANDKDLHTIRFQNDSTAVAAGKNKMIRITFKN